MQEIGIALKPTRSGAIVFNVAELSLDEAAQAAQDFQVNPAQCSPPQEHTPGLHTGIRARMHMCIAPEGCYVALHILPCKHSQAHAGNPAEWRCWKGVGQPQAPGEYGLGGTPSACCSSLCRPENTCQHFLSCSCVVPLQVRYSSSNPFIGKLSLKFLEVTNTKHGENLPPRSHPTCISYTCTMHCTHSALPGRLQKALSLYRSMDALPKMIVSPPWQNL